MARKRLRPEEKVEVAVDMVNVVTQIAADMERQRRPGISERALISILRRRFQLGRRIHSK